MRLANLLPLLLLSAALLSQEPAARQDDNRIATLYDIGDLVAKLDASQRPFEQPKLGLPGAAELDTDVGAEAIAQLLRAFVKPKLRANEKVNTVGERWVVALARPEQQAWIDRFLKSARSNEAAPVSIQCQGFAVPEITFLRDIRPTLVDVGTDLRGLGAGVDATTPKPNYVSQVLAPGDNTVTFLAEIRNHADVTSLTTQALHVLPLRTSHMATLNQTAFVRDFEIEVAKDAFIANPIVDVVQDGFLMQTVVSPLENGLLGVSLDATISELQRPITQFETQLPGTTQKVTIQLPSVQTTKLEAAFELRANNIVFMAPPPLSGRRTFFIVTVGASEAKKGQQKAPKKIFER